MDDDLVKIPENLTPTLTLTNRIAYISIPAPPEIAAIWDASRQLEVSLKSDKHDIIFNNPINHQSTHLTTPTTSPRRVAPI
jgi:hypothetical protein